MPTIEVEIVTLLIKFFRPELDDKGIALRLEKRKMKKRPVVFGSVLGENAQGICDDVICPDQRQEMIDSAKKYSKAVEELKLLGVANKVKGASAGSSKKRKKLGQKDPPSLKITNPNGLLSRILLWGGIVKIIGFKIVCFYMYIYSYVYLYNTSYLNHRRKSKRTMTQIMTIISFWGVSRNP